MSNETKEIIISEVNIMPVQPKDDGLVAIATVNFNGMLTLGSIAIYRKGTGYRLSYPLKKINDNRWFIFKPLNREVGNAIKNAILEEYDKMLSQDITEAIDDED